MISEEYSILRSIEENKTQGIMHTYHINIKEILNETKSLSEHVMFGLGKPMDVNLKKAKTKIFESNQDDNSSITKINRGIFTYCMQDNNKACELLASALFDGVDSIFAKLILNKIYLDTRKGRFINFSDYEISQFPNLNFMIALSFLSQGNIKKYELSMKKMINHVGDSNLIFILSNLLNISNKIATYDPRFDDENHKKDCSNNYIAAIGYRFSGGSALVDFLKTHLDVSSPFHEYKAISALMPIITDNTLNFESKVIKIILWLDRYILGILPPLHYFDVMPYNLLQNDKIDFTYNLRIGLLSRYIESNYFSFSLPLFLDSIWSSYMQNKYTLLLPKIFKLGDFRGVDMLPNLTTILITRDPRDQYVDRVNNGWMEEDSHKKFISQYEYYIRQTEKYLNMYKDFSLHQYNFEDLVTKQSTRDEILELCNLDKSKLGSGFDYKKSQKNIGVWKNYQNQREIDEIAKHFDIK